MFSVLIHLNRLKHYNIILPRETGNMRAQYTERRQTKQHNTIQKLTRRATRTLMNPRDREG